MAKLVYEEETVDLSEYRHMDKGGKATIYSTYNGSSTNEWIESPDPVDLERDAEVDEQLEELLARH